MRKIFILSAFIFLCISSAAYADIYVSPEGDDSNTGSFEEPFKTIERAQEEARKQTGEVNVFLREGYYHITDTLEFDWRDSNHTYSAYQNEDVVLEGGYEIKTDILENVTDENVLRRLKKEAVENIYKIDLQKIGITSIDDIEVTGFGMETNAYSENVLYCEGEMMHLARWPNEDTVAVKKIISAGSGANDTVKKGGIFEYDDEIVETWEDIENVWMWGAWYYEWSPSTTAIEKLDTEKNEITTKSYSRYGFMGGAKYYYFNVLEELDYPGEYYIDRDNLILYCYLEEKKPLYFTDTKNVMINIDNVDNITFSGITIQGTRNTAVTVNDGNKITFDGCTIRYIGKQAMNIEGGYNQKIINNEIYKMGAGGIYINSGDRNYLRSSDALIENNHIYDFSEIETTYTPAVQLLGIGIIIRNNLIHGTNHMAIQASGNDNIIEYNEIYDCVIDNDDAGAIYSYMDGSSRNIIVRYNFFHNIGRRMITQATGSWCIYWDGFTSGREVYGNVFYDCQGGIMINGGQIHRVSENIFVDVDRPIWSHPFTTFISIDFWKPCDNFDYNKGVWKIRYPEITEYRDNNQYLMYRENTVGNNIFYNCGESTIDGPKHEDAVIYLTPNITINSNEDIFKDPKNLDFTLKTQKYQGFENIDVSKMGLK